MRIGLALGGGVVRGLAHIGVLSVLEREGIPIYCVAGTSAGAIVGSLYAAGKSAAQIEAMALRLKWWSVARPAFSPRGLLTFRPLERWLAHAIGDIDIRDLPIPFAAVATDLERGEPVVFRHGPVALAARASSSVPGLVTPVVLDGRVLCDGGISDNLPVSAARALGAEFVVGVNLFDPRFRHPRSLLASAIEAIITMVRRAGGGISAADLLISPDLAGSSYVAFSKRLDLIARGKAAAEACLPVLRDVAAGRWRPPRREVQTEPHPAGDPIATPAAGNGHAG